MVETPSASQADHRLVPGQFVGWLVQFGTDDLCFVRAEEGLTVATMRAASLHGTLTPLVVDLVSRGKDFGHQGANPATQAAHAPGAHL